MPNPLRILIVDDSEDDALLLVRHLRAGGYETDHQRADTPDRLRAALAEGRRELVLCSHPMRHLSTPKALRLIRDADPDVPVILVSAALGEDELVRLIKLGAQDIVLRGNLARLRPAVERELAETQARGVRRRTRIQLITAIESIAEGIALFDADDRLVVCNRKYREFFDRSRALLVAGISYEEIVRNGIRNGQVVFDGQDPETFIQERLRTHRTPGAIREMQLASGRWLKVQERTTSDAGIICVATDITERKEREERLRRQADELTRSNERLQREMGRRKATEISLRESESLARAIFEGAADGLITFGTSGTVESANPAAGQIFGYGPGEIAGMPLAAILPEGLVRRGTPPAGSTNGKPQELLGRRRDGAPVPIEWTVSEVRLDQRTIFAGIVRDITERRKLDRMKSEFVSVVGHELRTPLTSIRGALALLQAEVTGALPAQARGMIDIAHANSERLIRLINDMLDIEKIESGRLRFEFQPLRLAAVIGEAVEACRAYADQFDVRLVSGPVGDGIVVMADRGRLAQVLANLLSNAVKFSPPGETVAIEARATAGAVRVSVSDRGPGIPEEFRGRVFEKFAQADSSDTRQKGGSGLGLSIAEAIVERHGGRIGFRTTAGRGTTFHFDLPVCQDRPHAGAAPAGAPPPRVLVCSGDALGRKALQRRIAGLGFEVAACAGADEAGHLLRDGPVAALAIDAGLLDRRGAALIAAARERSGTRAMPVVAIRSFAAGRGRRLEGRAAGIVDWLDRPPDLPRLRLGIERALAAAPARRARILCVTADRRLAEAVARLARDLGDVRVACPPARTQARAAPCDLAILDLAGARGPGRILPAGLFAGAAAGPPLILLSAGDGAPDLPAELAAALERARVDDETLTRQIGDLLGTVQIAADMRLLA